MISLGTCLTNPIGYLFEVLWETSKVWNSCYKLGVCCSIANITCMSLDQRVILEYTPICLPLKVLNNSNRCIECWELEWWGESILIAKVWVKKIDFLIWSNFSDWREAFLAGALRGWVRVFWSSVHFGVPLGIWVWWWGGSRRPGIDWFRGGGGVQFQGSSSVIGLGCSQATTCFLGVEAQAKACNQNLPKVYKSGTRDFLYSKRICSHTFYASQKAIFGKAGVKDTAQRTSQAVSGF